MLFNVGLRTLILVFTVDALVNAGDPRFAGKALGPRNVGILLGLSMLFPILHFIYKRWKRYPVWYDNLYLSIFWLDMAGNSLNLYNSVEWWDHIPHFHGPGALAMVLKAESFAMQYMGFQFTTDLVFFKCLSLAALIPEAPEEVRQGHTAALAAEVGKLAA